MQLIDLPLDACDRLLLHMSDYASLRNIVLSSKHIYEVFKTRKRSIIQTVEFNEVGPALPQALALVHTMIKQDLLEEALEELNNPESDYWKADGSIPEALALQNVAIVARRLENHYSCLLVYCYRKVLFPYLTVNTRRYKDQRASTSTLTEEESFRFRRALYRAWILEALTRKDTLRYSGQQNIHEVEFDFLSSTTDAELQELKEVVAFLGISLKTFSSITLDPSMQGLEYQLPVLL